MQKAPAKLTLSLRITGVRPDGYHEIDAEMVTVDLADELAFVPRPSTSLQIEDLTSGGLPVTTGPDNLVARALLALGCTASVHILKRIPAGAGLGGGSADAAAVYRWARRTSPSDVVASAALGADVPFCILGGRARVTGIGEVVELLPAIDHVFTLLVPPFGVSTPAVYRTWDALGGPCGPGVNDLESAALHVEPRLREWRDRLGEATGRTPVLAGSGGAWFVEGAFPGEGRIVTATSRRADLPVERAT